MSKKMILFILFVVFAILFVGCEGPMGPAGDPGTDGEDGDDVTLESVSSTFPGTEDTILGANPMGYIWEAGNYIEGVRSIETDNIVVGCEFNIPIANNLIDTGMVHFDIIANEVTMGSITIELGDTAIIGYIGGLAITDDEITVRLEVREDVESGKGSIQPILGSGELIIHYIES